MKITGEKKFTPAPEGVHAAVCVDIVDLGEVPTAWGPKHKIRVVWEIEHKMENGKPFLVSKNYTPTLGDKANLRKDLKSWRGRDFTADELAGFELDSILGANCQLVVVHNEKGEDVYANVSNVLKASKKLAASGSYVRKQDRPEEAHKPAVAQKQAEELADDDIPF